MTPSKDTPYRSGFVALVGRPNVGKSTLLNRLVGRPVSITSDKPQTTRTRILGVRHGEGFQVVFVDTPGIHQASSPLNVRMVNYALGALAEADLVLVLTEAGREAGPDEALVLERVAQAGRPAILLLNKIDLVSEGVVLEGLTHFGASGALGGSGTFTELMPISAKTGRGVERLENLIFERLKPGPPFFEEGQLTDQPEAVLIAELVRQEIFRRTHQEVPYRTAVRVERLTERKGTLVAEARIVVERDSQKGILIGKGGKMLKAIGSSARRKIEALLGTPLYLDLHVAVLEGWSDNPRRLAELGYPEA